MLTLLIILLLVLLLTGGLASAEAGVAAKHDHIIYRRSPRAWGPNG